MKDEADGRMKQAMKSTAHAVGTEIAGSRGERPTTGIVDLTAVESIPA